MHGAACGRKGAANEVLLACSPVLAAEAEREKSQDTRAEEKPPPVACPAGAVWVGN